MLEDLINILNIGFELRQLIPTELVQLYEKLVHGYGRNANGQIMLPAVLLKLIEIVLTIYKNQLQK